MQLCESSCLCAFVAKMIHLATKTRRFTKDERNPGARVLTGLTLAL